MSTGNRVLLMIENVALARDHRLRKHAAALVDAGFTVTVICPRDPGNRSVPGVRVLDYRPPADGGSKLGFVREYLYSTLMAGLLLVRAFCVGGFDVIQVSSTPDIYFVLAAPFRLLGKRVVFDFKDLSPEMYAARYGRTDGLMYRTLRRLERASLRVADQVLVVNDSLREIAEDRGGVSPDAITIVGNGPRLDRTFPRPDRPQLRRGYPYLCCLVGMMGPQDSVDLAIRAIDHLVHQLGRTDCAFTFVGVGDAVPDAQRLVAELGLDAWVSFPGWAEEELVFAYLSTADLGLEPNLEAFVSPVKAMEYMAFGLPFVAFDLTETRSLAAGAAAYAPPGDTVAFARILDTLLADTDQRERMGRIGKQRVRTSIAWEHQKERYVRVFQSLTRARRVERPGRSRPDGPLTGPAGGHGMEPRRNRG
jgi:glycosyltransferase involved in cell wall biosynthesis